MTRLIIGHSQTISDLKRLADSGTLSHAYLFHGPSMVGKRTVALALARFLEKGDFAPPESDKILQDLLVIDADFMKRLDPESKGSIGIDAVRELKSFLWRKPVASARRTAIIDEAENMTEEAQNAVLKILEEPPSSSLIILVSGDKEAFLPTIMSRAQAIYFSAVSLAAAKDYASRELKQEKNKAGEIAVLSFGKPGLARAIVHEKKLQEGIGFAKAFLATAPANRREFIKKLIEPEDFRLAEFLDAVIMLMSQEYVASCHLDSFRVGPRSVRVVPRLWHKVLELKRRSSYFGLNPRLQLENLLQQ